jgi:hypothetical protein
MTPKKQAQAPFEQAKRLHEELADLLGGGPPGNKPQDPYWTSGTDFQDLCSHVIERWRDMDPAFPSDIPTSSSQAES